MKYIYKGKELTPIVEIYHDVIPYLGEISEYDFFWDEKKCAHAWKTANTILSEFLGNYGTVNNPSAAPVSYGHLASIGGELSWPEDSEPNVRPFAHNIDEAIAILKERKHTNFEDNALCQHYRKVNHYLQEVFPDKTILPLSGYGVQGVITSAMLMRGQDFLLDLYDEPEKVHEYLKLMTESIIDFRLWSNRINHLPEVTDWSGFCDDFAALIPPNLFQEFVLPYWNRQYEATSTNKDSWRWLHCEDLYPEHLKFLKEIHINQYQPSVSPHLTLENVKANTDIPFDWLLYSWEVVSMSDQEIQNWVDQAVEAGITCIRTQFGKYAWSIGKQDRILAFYKAFDKYRMV